MGTNRRSAWGAALLLLAAAALRAAPIPAPTGNLSDFARVLGSHQKRTVEGYQKQLHDKGVDMGVCVIHTTAPRSSKEFAVAAIEEWGIGERGKDNGLLVLLVTGDRRVEIETGYGVEHMLTDAQAGELLDRHGVPHFKNGRWGDGLVALTRALRDHFPDRSEQSKPRAMPFYLRWWNHLKHAWARARAMLPTLLQLGTALLLGLLPWAVGARKLKNPEGEVQPVFEDELAWLQCAGLLLGGQVWFGKFPELKPAAIVVVVTVLVLILRVLWTRRCRKHPNLASFTEHGFLREPDYSEGGVASVGRACLLCSEEELLTEDLPPQSFLWDLFCGLAYLGAIAAAVVFVLKLIAGLLSLAFGLMAMVVMFPLMILLLFFCGMAAPSHRRRWSCSSSSSSWIQTGGVTSSSSSSSSSGSSFSVFGGGSSGGGGAGRSF